PGSWGTAGGAATGAPAGPGAGAPFGKRTDAPAAGATRLDDLDEDDDEDDEDDDERPRHPYTWLHLIVLALVAFVLGFLIVLLLNNARGEEPAANAAAPADAAHVSAPLTT
ncbi:hypothetical protein HGA02_00505, partial [Cellulomonas septica]|nr:hypothetical protein [Cellulomonas septica]